MKSRILLIIAALFLGIPATLADTIPADTLTPALPAPHMTYRYFGEGMAVSSSAHTPFWLMNNRFGLSSVEKNNGFIRGGFFRETDPDTRFSWGFGADLVVPYNFTSRFVIQQLYGEVRYRSLQLTVGSKERVTGLVNSELASGSMVLSQNARPIPQAYLSMPRYEPVPFTNRWLSVKGYFSFGVTTDGRWQRDTPHADSRWVKNELFHSKGLFIRVGDPDRHPLTVEGGLEMATHFGGEVHTLDPDGKPIVVKLPHDFKSIIKTIIPSGGGDSNDQFQLGEIQNAYGNHVGQWSLAATYRLPETEWAIRPYYLHYFDDHSMMFFDHAWRDMLLGFELSFPANRFIDKFVYEYLTTKDQSGAVYWDHTPEIPEQVSGRDNYYNHYLYPGWNHWGMGMGNPLIISPIYNANGSLAFYHNRIKGHHFGFSGRPTDEIAYRALLSFTRSWGTYDNPSPTILHNVNALIEATYSPRRIAGWDFRLSLGADGGDLLGKSFGAMLTIRKTGWIK